MEAGCGPNVSTGISDLEAAERGIPISSGPRQSRRASTPGSLLLTLMPVHVGNGAQGSNNSGEDDDRDDNYHDYFESRMGWCYDGLFSDSPKTGATVGNANDAYRAYFEGKV